jgi:hypothetical protein
MDGDEIIKKIISKKEFSQLPKKDVEIVFKKFERRQTSDEEKIKLTRDALRKIYSVFTSGKLLNKKILDKKNSEEILRKHISTRERFDFYSELYGKLFERLREKEISVFDFGAGINGLSYDFFPKDKKINYVSVEAVGQLNELVNYYFERNKFLGKAIHGSLFDIEKIKKIILDRKGKKILFMFKVIDSLEMVERDFSKKFLMEITPKVDFVVVSFATRSLVSGKKFSVKRYWFENFVREEFNVLDDFVLGSERYILFKKR